MGVLPHGYRELCEAVRSWNFFSWQVGLVKQESFSAGSCASFSPPSCLSLSTFPLSSLVSLLPIVFPHKQGLASLTLPGPCRRKDKQGNKQNPNSNDNNNRQWKEEDIGHFFLKLYPTRFLWKPHLPGNTFAMTLKHGFLYGPQNNISSIGLLSLAEFWTPRYAGIPEKSQILKLRGQSYRLPSLPPNF